MATITGVVLPGNQQLDLRTYTGPEAWHSVIAGHEPCGIIERVDPGVQRFKEGQRVIIYRIARKRGQSCVQLSLMLLPKFE